MAVELWVTKRQAAWLCDLSPQQFDTAIRPGLGESAIRLAGKGRALEFEAQAVVAALLAYRVPEQQVADADPMLSAGGDSPALEEYRAGKAAQVWMDVDERLGTHANLNDLGTMMGRFSGHIRNAGEILQRRFGNEASDILNSAIEDARRVCHEEIEKRAAASAAAQPAGDPPGNRPAGGTIADPATADPPRVRRR